MRGVLPLISEAPEDTDSAIQKNESSASFLAATSEAVSYIDSGRKDTETLMKNVLRIIRNLVLFTGSQKQKDEERILCILTELEQNAATLTGDIERLQAYMDSAANSILTVNAAAKTLGCKVDRLSEVEQELAGRQSEVADLHRQLELAQQRTDELQTQIWIQTETGILVDQVRACEARLLEMQQEALEREKILSKRSSESTAESMLADIRVLKKSVLTAEMDRAATCERLLQCIHKAHSNAVERVSAESKLREEVSACRRKLAYTEGAWVAAISALESTESLLGDARGRLLACGVVPGVCLAGQREADMDGGSKPGAKKGAGGNEEKVKGLQRQLDMMMRQRQGEQQAMILHMRSAEEESSKIKKQLALEQIERAKSDNIIRAHEMEMANLNHKLEMARLAVQSSQPGTWIAEDHAVFFPESPPRASSRGPVDAIAKMISGILSPTPSFHGERDSARKRDSAPANRRAGDNITGGHVGKASSSSLGTRLETIIGSPASSSGTQGGSSPGRFNPIRSPGSPAHASGGGTRGSSELRAHVWKSPPQLLSPSQSPSKSAPSKVSPSSSPERARMCGSPTNLPEEGDVFPELCSILPDVFTPTCNGTSSGNAVAGKSMAACSPVATQSISSKSGAGEEAGSEGWGVNTI